MSSFIDTYKNMHGKTPDGTPYNAETVQYQHNINATSFSIYCV